MKLLILVILGVAGNIVKKKIKRRLRTRSVKENDFCSIRGLEKICDARERRSHGNNSQLVSNLDLRNCVPTNDSPEFGTAAQLSVSTNKSQSEASHGWHNPLLECSPLRSISQALAPSQHSVIQSSDLSTYNPQPRFLNLCVNFQFHLIKSNFCQNLPITGCEIDNWKIQSRCTMDLRPLLDPSLGWSPCSTKTNIFVEVILCVAIFCILTFFL